jgi:hypothetical protein
MVVMLVCESAPFPWEWNQAEEMVRRRVFLNLQAYGGCTKSVEYPGAVKRVQTLGVLRERWLAGARESSENVGKFGGWLTSKVDAWEMLEGTEKREKISNYCEEKRLTDENA